MSFILDALRKSERERQRNRAPGISDMRTAAKPQKRGIWLPLAALLAGLNIALLALLWYTGGNEETAVTAAPAAAIPPATQNPMPAAAGGNRELTVEMEPVDDPARFASIAPPASSAGQSSAQASSPLPNPSPAAAPRPAPTSGGVDPRMPTVTEAMLDGRLSVQPLRMDLHVYSDNPSERFVFINTARYAEGDRTGEGLTVSEITEDGAVLNYQGQDYLLTSN